MAGTSAGMTKERVSLFLQYLQQLVTEDRRFYGRQISEVGRLREVGYGSRRLQIGERLVDGGAELRISGEADITPINADRIIVAGCGEPGIGMGGAVGIQAAQVEQCCIEFAAIERAEQVVPSGDQMRNVVDQASVFECHQDRVAKRAAFDRDAQPGEIADA